MKEHQIRMIELLDGAAAVNLDEPISGDLERVTAAYMELRKWLANIISVNPQNYQSQLARKALKGHPHE